MPSVQANSDVHGSASLLERTEKRVDWTLTAESASGVPLGHNPDDRDRGRAFNLAPGRDPGHALTFGATRSGKGVSTIIPALLTYGGSALVLDPKLENAWITAPYRRKIGQRVVILDPWNEINQRYGSQVGEVEVVTRFNPLSALDPKDPNFNDDVSAMADALTVKNNEKDAHWIDSARELIAGLIAAAVERNPGGASLRSVRELVTGSDEDLTDSINHLLAANPNGLAARKLRRFKPRVDKAGNPIVTDEIASVRSTAETQTAFLDSENLLQSMETDDPPFNLADLGDTDPAKRVTLYVGLPIDRLQTHGRWLRLILTLAIRAIARQKRPPPLPVLFMLDELGTISPGAGLPMIEQSFGLMAGIGIRVWAFLQDLPQLQRDYPNSWETFVSNSSVIQVLNCADATTSEYISRYLGTMTVDENTGSWSWKQKRWNPGEYKRARNALYFKVDGSAGPKQRWANVDSTLKESGMTADFKHEWEPDTKLTGRPVLMPDEVRQSPADSSIIIFPRGQNYRLRRFVYYSDPVLGPRARPDPNKDQATLTPVLETDREGPPAKMPAMDPDTGPDVDERTPEPPELASGGPGTGAAGGKAVAVAGGVLNVVGSVLKRLLSNMGGGGR